MGTRPLLVWPMLVMLALMQAADAAGKIIVEDFEDGPVAAFDPFINYQFVHPGLVSARFVNDFFSPPGYLLFLGGNTTGILTFNTLPFQFITFASLEFADHSGGGSPTFVEFIGTNRTEQFSLKNSGPITISTAGLGLGAITQIRLLGSLESSFDNITLEVVPEPSTLGLATFLLSMSTAVRRRKSR